MQNLYFVTQSFLDRKILRLSAGLFLAAMLAALTGCGSGQAIPQVFPTPTTSGTSGVPVAGSIQLLASSSNIASSGANTVGLTAVVLSAAKQTIAGATVTITATSALGTAETAYVELPAITDAAGSTTTKLHLGTNRTNRTLTITASADNISTTNNIEVVGTAIKISGSSSVAFGTSTTLTFSVKDSDGTALTNTPVTIASQYGNAVTPTIGATDSKGEIQATVVATKTGTGVDANLDRITASAAGTSATQTLSISADSLAFQAPTLAATATSIDIPLNTPTAVSVNWATAGVPQVSKNVNFSVSRGAITAAATTDAAGNTPGVTTSSTTAGPAIITASTTGSDGSPLAATREVVFVATSANTATLQAVPGTIQVSTGTASQTSNSSTISVQVRDAANNLVKNAAVNFTITLDPSNGSLSSGQAVTDGNGSASVTYTAGATSSPANGVNIRSEVTKVNGVTVLPVGSVVGTTALTVANQPLLVRLNTDNKIISNTPLPTYSKTFAAVVTDANGNASVGTTVRFGLRPGRYWKGYYQWVSAAKKWVQIITTPGPDDLPAGPGRCANEDTNNNGQLDKPPVVAVSEDFNNNGSLDPGNVASITGSSVTDANGIAYATVTYPKGYATWVEEILEARTGVSSNDPPAQYTYSLEGLAADYTDEVTAPPGQYSPWGVGSKNTTPPGYGDCSNSN